MPSGYLKEHVDRVYDSKQVNEDEANGDKVNQEIGKRFEFVDEPTLFHLLLVNNVVVFSLIRRQFIESVF